MGNVNQPTIPAEVADARELTLTNDEIREFNLWLYDNPQYKRMSWREQVTFWQALRERKEAA